MAKHDFIKSMFFDKYFGDKRRDETVKTLTGLGDLAKSLNVT
jgi:hypothetical protein